jgi:hypothetical protein
MIFSANLICSMLCEVIVVVLLIIITCAIYDVAITVRLNEYCHGCFSILQQFCRFQTKLLITEMQRKSKTTKN